MAKERQFWKTLKAVVFFVACAVLGFALAQTSLMEMLIPSDGVSVWAAVAALFIAPVFVIFVHELGHLLVGLVQGFAFRLFVVGPFGWRQERDEGVHFFWNTNLSLMGGVAATVPKAERSDVELAFARTLLAGPVVSLLAALLSLVLAVYTQSSFDAFLGISALGNFAIFLATTLPEKSGAFFSDRKRWQRLRSDGPEQASELALLHGRSGETPTAAWRFRCNHADLRPVLPLETLSGGR